LELWQGMESWEKGCGVSFLSHSKQTHIQALGKLLEIIYAGIPKGQFCVHIDYLCLSSEVFSNVFVVALGRIQGYKPFVS